LENSESFNNFGIDNANHPLELFANAGVGIVAPLAVATEARFDRTFDVNVKGLFFTVQKALPLFKDGGSIILTSSVSNVLGLPAFSVYAASKAAVRNFARAWTLELKDRKFRVNSMSPGPTETSALEKTTDLTPEQCRNETFAMRCHFVTCKSCLCESRRLVTHIYY